MNDLMQQAPLGDDALPEANAIALRLALEEVWHLANQSRLMALNAALESASACQDAAAGDMLALGRASGQSLAEAEQIVAAVELLLLQMPPANAVRKAL